MNTPLSILLYVAMAAVFGILVLGLLNLFSKSEKQPSRSNKLMRLRVLAQFIAILILIAIGFSSGAIG